MPKQVDRTAGSIDWPTWSERTPERRRERTSKFSVTLASAISDIEIELEDRLDVDDWRLSTAAPHRKSDGRPYADARPDDPGAVVRWSNDGEQFAVACDQYTKLRDNVREIGLWIQETRKKENRPVKTGQSEFATARLPPADEDDVVAAGPGGRGRDQDPHEVLGVSPDAPDPVVRGAFRELVKNEHGDHGGEGDVSRLKEARDALLEDGDPE